MTTNEMNREESSPDEHYMVDRVIPDPASGGPPTAHNEGWYTQYLPEQRGMAYLLMYDTYVRAAVNNDLDDLADYAFWVLGHAVVDAEGMNAIADMIEAEPEGPGKEGLANWFNSVYGPGMYQDNMGTPEAALRLPKIDMDDPEGVIEKFVYAGIEGWAKPTGTESYRTDTQTEKAMLLGVGLMEKAGNFLGDLASLIPGVDQPEHIDPDEKYEHGDATPQQLWESVGENLYGPEEGGAAFRRNLQNTGTKMLSDYSVAAVAMAGTRMPIAGAVGQTRARLLEDRFYLRQAMSRRWTGEMMAVGGPSRTSLIGQAMKEVVPNGVGLTAAKALNGLAQLGTLAKVTPGPVGWAASASPRVKFGLAAATTLGAEVYRASRMPVGDIDLGTFVEDMPDGANKDYILQMLEQVRHQGAVTSAADAGIYGYDEGGS